MSVLPIENLAIREESAMNLNGQVALVTGSSRGIERIAVALARADIVLTKNI
jgi:hypothetical protein